MVGACDGAGVEGRCRSGIDVVGVGVGFVCLGVGVGGADVGLEVEVGGRCRYSVRRG